MSLGLGGFVILLLSTLLPFSGTFNLSVNQGLYSTLGMVSAKKVRESQNSVWCQLRLDIVYSFIEHHIAVPSCAYLIICWVKIALQTSIAIPRPGRSWVWRYWIWYY